MATAMRPVSLSRPLSFAVGAGLAVVALITAPAATLVSRMCWRNGLVTVPYGLVLGVAGSMGVVLLARAASRLTGFAALAGWLAGLVIVTNGTSGGSFLIANDGLGWGFLVCGTVAVMGAALVGGRRS